MGICDWRDKNINLFLHLRPDLNHKFKDKALNSNSKSLCTYLGRSLYFMFLLNNILFGAHEQLLTIIRQGNTSIKL